VTYSIVARDSETGQLGIAVQTRSFAVGAAVPWAEAGVGAIATQSFTERSYGPLALQLLRAGRTPEETLAGLVTADPQEEVRQVGIVDATGRGAAHTGELCIKECGHLVRDGITVQANMMASADVWPAMAETFARATGSFPQQLLAALDAAEAAGGDFRGRATAAMLIVEEHGSGRPWDDRVIDVRVDDHADPLGELRRLVTLAEAYRRLNRLSGEVSVEELDAAQAAGVAPDHLEWFVVTAAWRAHDLELAKRQLQPLVEREPRWQHAWDLLVRMPPPDPED
jgi:uncharacterized Ntn-hydrolase superfamily protein